MPFDALLQPSSRPPAAKFGALYLDGGRRQGRQVIPPEWVRESTRRHIAVRDSISDFGEHGYGYLWWHDRFRMPAGDLEVHTAVGNGAQRVFMIPSLHMVVVHLAGRYNDPDADWMPERLLLEHILPAVEGGPAQAPAETGSTADAETACR
jgi:CubicO group peptidase (beta-lactamase class C family)